MSGYILRYNPTGTTSTTTTTITTTTTTTTTHFIAGEECASDYQCISRSCQTHCCAEGQLRLCSTNGGDCGSDGQCHTYDFPLGINATSRSNWTDTAVTELKWPTLLKQRVPILFNAPPLNLKDAIIRSQQTDTAGTVPTAVASTSLAYKLMWTPQNNNRTDAVFTALDVIGTTPPAGLVDTGTVEASRSDPQQVTVIADSGVIMMVPETVGKYTMWLLIEDTARPLASVGLTGIYDQTVVARWEFEVAADVQFSVTNYTRATTGYDATKYVTENKPSLKCVVGGTYKVAPIDLDTIQTENEVGSREDLTFTLKNAPKGFFIDSATGELLGVPTEPTPPYERAIASL
jgi:hypothetical protein